MKGKKFRKWRRSKEISQQKVADYCGCHKSTICRFEKGQINLLPNLMEKLFEFMNKYKKERKN